MGKGTKVLGSLVLAAVIVQFIPVDRSNPPERQPLVIQDSEVASLMDRACADCHSHNTTWPWYGRIAPVSWWLASHIDEGREHFNLSTWGELAPDRQDHVLEEFVEMLEEAEMPLRSYTLVHSEARLTDQERRLMTDWANRLRQSLEDPRADAEVVHQEADDSQEG